MITRSLLHIVSVARVSLVFLVCAAACAEGYRCRVLEWGGAVSPRVLFVEAAERDADADSEPPLVLLDDEGSVVASFLDYGGAGLIDGASSKHFAATLGTALWIRENGYSYNETALQDHFEDLMESRVGSDGFFVERHSVRYLEAILEAPRAAVFSVTSVSGIGLGPWKVPFERISYEVHTLSDTGEWSQLGEVPGPSRRFVPWAVHSLSGRDGPYGSLLIFETSPVGASVRARKLTIYGATQDALSYVGEVDAPGRVAGLTYMNGDSRIFLTLWTGDGYDYRVIDASEDHTDAAPLSVYPEIYTEGAALALTPHGLLEIQPHSGRVNLYGWRSERGFTELDTAATHTMDLEQRIDCHAVSRCGSYVAYLTSDGIVRANGLSDSGFEPMWTVSLADIQER